MGMSGILYSIKCILSTAQEQKQLEIHEVVTATPTRIQSGDIRTHPSSNSTGETRKPTRKKANGDYLRHFEPQQAEPLG